MGVSRHDDIADISNDDVTETTGIALKHLTDTDKSELNQRFINRHACVVFSFSKWRHVLDEKYHNFSCHVSQEVFVDNWLSSGLLHRSLYEAFCA